LWDDNQTPDFGRRFILGVLNINGISAQNYPRGGREEIPVCDGYTCSRIDKPDRENKMQEESQR
jgi:hypothetical protein